MGVYINPFGESKEIWLVVHGTPSPQPTWDQVPKGQIAVCLVDNFHFTAAGVAYSKHEMKAFQSPSDHRPRRWYFVPLELLTDEIIGDRAYLDSLITRG